MIREMICIVCPMGCPLTVDIENGVVVSVAGNTCPRGKAYAETECVNPQRTVTTTVLCENGQLLPVKTDRPVNKDDVFEVMKSVNSYIVPLPVNIGDIVMRDVCGSNIIATGTVK